MVSARAMVTPGKWTGRDASWPKVSLKYVSPIRNAFYDWAADNLELGALPNWRALNRDVSLAADSVSAPMVVESNGFKAVRFNGTTDRMRVKTPDASTEHTIVSVYRFTNYQMGDSVLYGYNDSAGGTISSNINNDTLSAYSGVFLAPTPKIPGDNSWHIAMSTSNFTNSAFRFDGYEVIGNLTTVKREGLTLGYSTRSTAQNDDMRAPIEYRRNLILPALSAAERLALYQELKAQYKM